MVAGSAYASVEAGKSCLVPCEFHKLLQLPESHHQHMSQEVRVFKVTCLQGFSLVVDWLYRAGTKHPHEV